MSTFGVMRVIRFSLVLFMLFLGSTAWSQETIFDEKTTIYSLENSGGVGIHTNGFSAVYRYAKFTSGFTKTVYEFEVANIRHPQEIKSINPFEDNTRGYVLGKLNQFYTFRPNIGFHKVFIPKQSVRGVSVAFVSHFGASLGFTKPVYLNITEREPNSFGTNIVKRKYDPDIHSSENIYSKASFLNGIDELKFYPGGFVRFGFHFDFATSRDHLRSIEVGAKMDVFAREVPIMAFTTNRAIYPNLYISLLFGSRKV